MCRHIYDWNIVNCDVKQTIQQQQQQQQAVENKYSVLDLPGNKFYGRARKKK